MMTITHRITTTALAVTAAAVLVPTAGAAPSAGSTGGVAQIIGGTRATNAAVVQLAFTQDGGRYGCTGEVIADQWVLTARHCTDGSSNMDVYFSNSVTSPGAPVRADKLVNSPYGDVALVHLPVAAKTSSRMTMTTSFTPKAGTSGVIMGYGLRAAGAEATNLGQATVSLVGTSRDAYNGSAIHLKGVNGASNHGDSGGPLVVGGVIVGVCSTGDNSDPGSDIHAGSNYANLTSHRAWIKKTAGV